jgi:hypothetical protein
LQRIHRIRLDQHRGHRGTRTVNDLRHLRYAPTPLIDMHARRHSTLPNADLLDPVALHPYHPKAPTCVPPRRNYLPWTWTLRKRRQRSRTAPRRRPVNRTRHPSFPGVNDSRSCRLRTPTSTIPREERRAAGVDQEEAFGPVVNCGYADAYSEGECAEFAIVEDDAAASGVATSANANTWVVARFGSQRRRSRAYDNGNAIESRMCKFLLTSYIRVG